MKKLSYVILIFGMGILSNTNAQTHKTVKATKQPVSGNPTKATNQTSPAATSGNGSHAPAPKSNKGVKAPPAAAPHSVNQATPPFNSGANGGAPPAKHP